MLRVGVQVSIAGKISQAVQRAVNLGCQTMQIFSRNPRSFRRKPLDKEDIKEFRRLIKEAKIYPLVIHTVYTQNLASSNKRFYRLSIRAFIKDLQDAQNLGADLIVTHIGSFKRSTHQRGLVRVIDALGQILKRMPMGPMLLLENTSGSGHWLGAYFPELTCIIKSLGTPKNLGICFDTCHAYSAGYNLKEQKILNSLVYEVDSLIGLDKLKLIHLNDTKDKLGSHRDRHEHIGEGQIGKEGFREILNHPKLKSVPFILETPKKSDEDDIRNLEMVRSLYQG